MGGGHDLLVWKDRFAEVNGVIDGWLECEEVFLVLFILYVKRPWRVPG